MMIYSLEDLNLREIRAIRKSLDYIPITGIDATFIAILQNKIQQQIQQIEDFLKQEEEEKQKSLTEALQNDSQSTPPQGKKKA
jgi:cell division protein ZapA (FtsZ GTPase activity inhibitor)